MIAALFVEKNGVYYGLPDVDPWDEQRDARKYAGPWPVIAHPPCERWSKPLAFVNQTRYGHKVGDDGGCFDAAKNAVETYGGVLEHPANSAAWDEFALTKPNPNGGWTLDQRASDFCGWVCSVAQRHFGHKATKNTWLYACLPRGYYPPRLPAGKGPPAEALVSGLTRTSTKLPRLSKKEAKATPLLFRDFLIKLVNDPR